MMMSGVQNVVATHSRNIMLTKKSILFLPLASSLGTRPVSQASSAYAGM
jgi:hypothetical protein